MTTTGLGMIKDSAVSLVTEQITIEDTEVVMVTTDVMITIEHPPETETEQPEFGDVVSK